MRALFYFAYTGNRAYFSIKNMNCQNGNTNIKRVIFMAVKFRWFLIYLFFSICRVVFRPGAAKTGISPDFPS